MTGYSHTKEKRGPMFVPTRGNVIWRGQPDDGCRCCVPGKQHSQLDSSIDRITEDPTTGPFFEDVGSLWSRENTCVLRGEQKTGDKFEGGEDI